MSTFLSGPINSAKALLTKAIGTQPTDSTSGTNLVASGSAPAPASVVAASSGGDTFIWLGIIAALAAAVWFSLKGGKKKSPAKARW